MTILRDHSDSDDALVSTAIDVDGRQWRRLAIAAGRVMGDSDVAREIQQMCSDHAETRRTILTSRVGPRPVIAIVGATGQGKSWLARQFVSTSHLAAIRSGNDRDAATEYLTWIGPQPPVDLDSRSETFIACESTSMRNLGCPYVIVDVPGATDDRRHIAATARRALAMASVLILVVRRDQLRSQSVTGLAAAGEGTIVVPLINAIRQEDDSQLHADAEALINRLRNVAPHSSIMPPVHGFDFEVNDRTESGVSELLMKSLSSTLTECLEQLGGDRRRCARLLAADQRFRDAIATVLQNELPELTNAVTRLNEAAERLPAEVATMLLGSGEALAATIRYRLRARMLTATPALCFPYRSLLSLLNLTHGAWDRVVLSLSGSLPSLIAATVTGVQNWNSSASQSASLRDDIRHRAETIVADRLAPLSKQFRDELHHLNRRASNLTPNELPDDEGSTIPLARLSGLDSLHEQSEAVFDQAIDDHGLSHRFATLLAFIGTLVFWGFAAGPLANLYQHYLSASGTTLGDLIEQQPMSVSIEEFPRPTASFLITSMLLSVLPTAVLAMIFLTWSQARRRVQRIAGQLRDQHQVGIASLQRGGVLRLTWRDPLLSDAEFLLSFGKPREHS
ncbi:MAG: GTPase domain-containing protein [Planctomycetota bacterium]